MRYMIPIFNLETHFFVRSILIALGKMVLYEIKSSVFWLSVSKCIQNPSFPKDIFD